MACNGLARWDEVRRGKVGLGGILSGIYVQLVGVKEMTTLNFGKSAVQGSTVVCVVRGTELQQDKINWPYKNSGKQLAKLTPQEREVLSKEPMQISEKYGNEIAKLQDNLVILFEGEQGEQFNRFNVGFKLIPGRNDIDGPHIQCRPNNALKAFVRMLGVNPEGNVNIDEVIRGKRFKATVIEPNDRGNDQIDPKSIRSIDEADPKAEASVGDEERLKKLKAFIEGNSLKISDCSPSFIYDEHKKSSVLQEIGTPYEIVKLLKLV